MYFVVNISIHKKVLQELLEDDPKLELFLQLLLFSNQATTAILSLTLAPLLHIGTSDGVLEDLCGTATHLLFTVGDTNACLHITSHIRTEAVVKLEVNSN